MGRFGKSYAANMLTAYYSKGCDSEKMFSDLEISRNEDFRTHLNKYDVIHIDVQWFLANCKSVNDIIGFITESILEELREIYPGILTPYVGFTEAEVKKLCVEYGQDFDKVKRWYDGYLLKDEQVYNPRAVTGVMLKQEFKSYWSETASYEAIVPLINMNFDGLKTAIIEMLSGAVIEVNTATFKNDTLTMQSRDDVLTYMIHLGYLGYDQEHRTAFVPNEEIRLELTNAVESPALVVELKWNHNAETAIQQIKDKNYVGAISSYTGEILMVAISYDKKSKRHCCEIEKCEK